MHGTEETFAGGVSEETNARGIIVDSTNTPIAHVSVGLYPADFNPCIDTLFDTATTDSKGAYSIPVRTSVRSVIFATISGEANLRYLDTSDFSTVHRDTLRRTGSVRVILPSNIDSTGEVFIAGTPLHVPLKNHMSRINGTPVITFAGVPAKKVDGICYLPPHSSIPQTIIDSLFVVSDSTISTDSSVAALELSIASISGAAGLIGPKLTFTCMTIDSARTIWVGTAQGSIFHISGQSVVVYPEAALQISADIPINAITTFSDGTVWASTGTGIVSWNGSIWTRHDASNLGTGSSVYASITEDKVHKRIWISQNGTGLLAYTEKIWNNGVATGLPTIFDSSRGDIPLNVISNLTIDSAGQIWGATANGFTVISDTVFHTYTNVGGTHNGVTTMAPAPNGNIWMATGDLFISQIEGPTRNLVDDHPKDTTGMIGGPISCMAIDLQGLVWAANTAGHVACYTNGLWRHWNLAAGLYFTTMASSPNGSVYGITADGRLYTLKNM